MNSNTNLITITTTTEWNSLNRPHQINRDLRSITEFLEIHQYPVRKLASREVWRIGKGDSIWLLSYDDTTEQWILFPHNQNWAYIIVQAINFSRLSSQQVG